MSPELTSLNMGSMNFGLFPILDKAYDWKHKWEPEYLEMTRDFIFRNTFKDIEWVLKTLGEEHGVRFEFECYDMGHLYNLAHFVDRKVIEPPFLVQTIFGILGGIAAEWENLAFMKSTVDRLFGDGATFAIGGIEARVVATPGHTPACMTYVVGDACFVGDEQARPQAGGFYGGWITSGLDGPFKGEPGSEGW